MEIKDSFNDPGPKEKPLTVAVFAGSSVGVDPADKEDAIYVGRTLGLNGIRLVYGGGDWGNMGFVSRACLEAGGIVKGFNLSCFSEAHDYPQRSFETVCRSIAIRKEEMLAEADAYIALGGGIGTLDEIADAANEQNTTGWMNPPVPKKPIILVNRGGLYDHIRPLFEAQVRRGYSKPEALSLITIAPDGQGAMQEIAKHFGINLRLSPEGAAGPVQH